MRSPTTRKPSPSKCAKIFPALPDATASGLTLLERFASWDRDPYTGGEYAVSVLSSTAEADVSHAR